MKDNTRSSSSDPFEGAGLPPEVISALAAMLRAGTLPGTTPFIKNPEDAMPIQEAIRENARRYWQLSPEARVHTDNKVKFNEKNTEDVESFQLMVTGFNSPLWPKYTSAANVQWLADFAVDLTQERWNTTDTPTREVLMQLMGFILRKEQREKNLSYTLEQARASTLEQKDNPKQLEALARWRSMPPEMQERFFAHALRLISQTMQAHGSRQNVREICEYILREHIGPHGVDFIHKFKDEVEEALVIGFFGWFDQIEQLDHE